MRRASFILVFSFLFLALFQFAHASAFDDGMGAYYQKQWSQAETSFRSVLAKNPNDSLALVYFIVSSYQGGDFAHQMHNLEDHLVDYPDDQRAQIWLAMFHYTQAYVEGKDPAPALGELRQAARMGPSPIVHTGIGIIYYDLGNLSRAQRELARAMDMNPKDVLAYEYMGKILLSFAHDPKDAMNYFEQEIRLAPDYPDGHYYLARTYAELGQANNAIREYQKTVVLDPFGVGRGADARISLGDLYVKLGQFDLAARTFQKALELDPQNQGIKQRLEDLAKQRKSK